MLYGLEVCPFNSADKASFDFVLTKSLGNVIQTNSIDVISECCYMFNIRNVSDFIDIVAYTQ